MDPGQLSEPEELSSRDLYLLDQARRKKRKPEVAPEKKKVRSVKSRLGAGAVPVAQPQPLHVYEPDNLGRIKVLQTCLGKPFVAPNPLDVLIQVMESESPAPALAAPTVSPTVSPAPALCDLVPLGNPAPTSPLSIQKAVLPLTATPTSTPLSSASATATSTAPEKVSIFKKQFVPVKLEKMYGQDSAIQSARTWFSGGHWKKKPLIVWGPSGTGKTLLCSLLAAAFQSTCVSFEDEFDVKDKVKGWLQGSRSQGLGLLAFTHEVHKQAWLFLDDFDSIEGECRKELLPLLKPYMEAKSTQQFPAPVMITCENVHDKKMAGLKALKNWVQLVPHSIANLTKLACAVAPNLDAALHHQLATLARGDARRLIMEARFAKEVRNVPKLQHEDVVYHTPFDAVKALISKPAIESRALDGQEFMVQQLMYQNYPLFNSSLELISQVADEFCQLDLLDSEHEFPEYSEVYLTYIIPKEIKGKVKFNLNLNPKYMKQTFEKPKKGKMLF